MERRVPAAVLITLLIQLGAALIWATQLEARVNGAEQRALDGRGLSEKFARLEERLEFLKQDIGGVKNQLVQMNERLLRK